VRYLTILSQLLPSRAFARPSRKSAAGNGWKADPASVNLHSLTGRRIINSND